MDKLYNIINNVGADLCVRPNKHQGEHKMKKIAINGCLEAYDLGVRLVEA